MKIPSEDLVHNVTHSNSNMKKVTSSLLTEQFNSHLLNPLATGTILSAKYTKTKVPDPMNLNYIGRWGQL